MPRLRKRLCAPPAVPSFALGAYGEAALRACGGRWRRGVRGLATLARCFREERGPLPADSVLRARALFDWLGWRRPHAYRSGGNSLLSLAIEAHESPAGKEVGNCLALTCLFLALGEGLGLPVVACHLPDASGRGPHVLALSLVPGREIDLELTRPDGFDFPGLQGLPGRRRWMPNELAAEVVLARGNRALEAGLLRNALALYRRALALDPRHERAWLNLGIVYVESGHAARAEECFARALYL